MSDSHPLATTTINNNNYHYTRAHIYMEGSRQVPEASHASVARQATNAESTEDDESRSTEEDESRESSSEAATSPGGSCTSSMSASSVATEAEAEEVEAEVEAEAREGAEAHAQAEAEAEAEASEGATAAGPAAAAAAAAPLAATSRRGSSKSVSGFRLQSGHERVMYLVGVGVGVGVVLVEVLEDLLHHAELRLELQAVPHGDDHVVLVEDGVRATAASACSRAAFGNGRLPLRRIGVGGIRAATIGGVRLLGPSIDRRGRFRGQRSNGVRLGHFSERYLSIACC